QARAALATRMTEFSDGTPEHASAELNDAELAAEIARRGTDETERNAQSLAMARRVQGPPCVYAIDNESRRLYLSVTGAENTLEDVARFVYGSATFAARLAEENALPPDQPLPAGTTLQFVEGPLPETARSMLSTALETGSIVRTEGIPENLEGDGMFYQVPVGGQVSQLTAAQFNAVLKGYRRVTGLEITRIRSLVRILKEVRDSHEESTNSWVRGISDWRGDVDLPGNFQYILLGAMLEALGEELEGEAFEGEPTQNARRLQNIQTRLVAYSGRYNEMDNEWHTYINGTIQGASKNVSTLETVRNVSFAAVAGMAGAVAAPAIFAAASGTAIGGVTIGSTGATVLGLGGAAGTGGLVRGGLEIAVPGAQVQEYEDGTVVVGDDNRSAWRRFADTAPGGAVQGFTGGVGAFMAPAVGLQVNNQLASRFGSAFVHSGRGQLVSQVTTGMVIGAPTSAGGTALEALPAYARGDITGSQYAGAIGTGTLYGTLLGGVTAPVPINGLYRQGGALFRPSAAPVTPRWMMAGPRSPLSQFSRRVPSDAGPGVTSDIPEGFHTLVQDQLPVFADDPGVAGMSWMRVRSGGRDEWAPIRTFGPDQEFQLNWHDTPTAGPTANRSLVYGPRGTDPAQMRLVGTRATQRPQLSSSSGNSYQGNRDFPMESADYTFTDDAGNTIRYVRGHRVDHRDTTDPTALIPNSTIDAANYSPEPASWGSGAGHGFRGRVQLTNKMSRDAPDGGTQYGQIEYYGASPRTTADLTPIPEQVIFIKYGADGAPEQAWRIRYSDPDVIAGTDMNTATRIDSRYGISDMTQVPTVREISVDSLPPGVFGGVAGPQIGAPFDDLEGRR
ncbi:MAG: hypothetical protein ACR2OY_02955, partial [Boseongicola sp.]